jgi:hypothetical protein
MVSAVVMCGAFASLRAQQPDSKPGGIAQVWIQADLARPARPNACLHGDDESRPEAERRREAAVYVQRIIVAQAAFFERRNRYADIGELGSMGGVPRGFVLQHASARVSYLLSLKDEQDPCGYALYSDHTRVIYAATPLPALEAGLLP